jgi:hypothetical protein
MNPYAQKMRDMLARVGEPIVTKTTVEPPKQKLDLGTLMMMLMMQGMFKKSGGEDLSALNTMPSPGSMTSVLDALGPSAIPGLMGGGGGMEAVSGAIPMASVGGAAFGGGGDTGGFSGLTPEMLFKVLLGMGGR